MQIVKLERMLAIQFRRFKQEINALHGDKLTGHEYLILRLLSQNQPQMMSQLAKEFGVTASYTTIVVDKLLQKGYVNRERSKRDRRIVELTVTESGESVIKELDKIRRDYLHKAFENLTDEQLKTLNSLVSKLI